MLACIDLTEGVAAVRRAKWGGKIREKIRGVFSFVISCMSGSRREHSASRREPNYEFYSPGDRFIGKIYRPLENNRLAHGFAKIAHEIFHGTFGGRGKREWREIIKLLDYCISVCFVDYCICMFVRERDEINSRWVNFKKQQTASVRLAVSPWRGSSGAIVLDTPRMSIFLRYFYL